MPRIVVFLIFDRYQILVGAGPIAPFEIAADCSDLSAYEVWSHRAAVDEHEQIIEGPPHPVGRHTQLLGGEA